MAEQLKTKDDSLNACLKAALQKDKGSAAQLLSWTLEDFTKMGNNFFIMVTSAKITYKLGSKEYPETYIVKMMPVQPVKALKDMFYHSFKKELSFYQELAPALNVQLKTIGLAPLRIPISLHLNKDPNEMFLIMSDLRSQGFRPFKEKICLDIPHTKLILQELAKMHASSILLEAKIGRQNFDVKYSFLEKEWYNVTADALALFKTLLEGHVENAISILKMFKYDDRAIKWLSKIKPDVYDMLQEEMKRNSVFVAFCHADCTSTNVLFRYSEGIPVEVALLDFQQTRKSSIVTDINLLLYACLYGTDRKKNTHALLQTYYTSFKNVLKSGKYQMPFTFQELLQEYQDKILFGALWGMSLIPMLIGGEKICRCTDPKEEEDVDEKELLERAKIRNEKSKAAVSKITRIESEFKQRLVPIFDELIESGIIR